MSKIEVIVWRSTGGVRTEARLGDASDHRALDQVEACMTRHIERGGRYDLFRRYKHAFRRACHQLVEEWIGTQRKHVAALVGAVHVEEGCIQLQRRHGNQLLAIVERTDDGFEDR